MMGFIDYPFPKKSKSFVQHEEVLAFYHLYASTFRVNDVIKFNYRVDRVHHTGHRWQVNSPRLKRNE